VSTPPLEGLGADMSLIKRICSDDPEAVNLLDEAIGSHQGERTDLHNNVIKVESAPVGNTARQAIRKLRDKRPDLHARVIARELSPHAAMVEAKFRTPTITIPLDPRRAARLLHKHFIGDAWQALLDALEAAPAGGGGAVSNT
jgi:hypothetical protein